MKNNPQISPMDTDQKDPETHAVIGAAMEVHRQLGCGFLEAVYQEAIALEFQSRKIPFARELDLPITYKGEKLHCSYRADFICFGAIVVELKALSGLTGVEFSQVLNYLKATGHPRGLLINFGSERLEYERLVFTPRTP